MRFSLPVIFREASITLLLVLPRSLIRADFTGRPPRLQRVWQSDAPMGETLAVMADAAFALGPNRRTRVHLLSANFWTGVLSLSSAKAGTLSANELAQALGFEAETLSNINPFDSLLAATPLAAGQGSQSFWVTQASRAEVVAIEETLLRRGAGLASVAHPGGLPCSLNQAPVPWQRAELWGDNVICLHHVAGSAPRLQIFAAAPAGQIDLPAEAETWLGRPTENTPREIFVAPGVTLKRAATATHDLSHEAVLHHWLARWADELSGKAIHVPVLRPPPRPMPAEKRMAVATLWTIAAIGLCAGHWFWLQHHEAALRLQLASVQAPAKKLDDLKSQADAAEKKVADARAQMLVLTQLSQDWETVLQQEQNRHAILLNTIAAASSSDFVLAGLNESGGRMKVTVLADSPELPDFTAQLAAAVAPFDWRVQSPVRQALRIWNDGGPWQLDWTLLPETTNAVSATGITPPGAGATRWVRRPASQFQ